MLASAIAVCTSFVGVPVRRPVVIVRRQAFNNLSWQTVVDREGIEFLGSYAKPQELPKSPLPEICLVGRSNVGKSSALNTLSGRRKKVAVVSKTPGRTRLLNMFKVGNVCHLMDLPGYGYAKVSKDMQDAWRKNIEAYLKKREQLRLAILFVDSQREPQEADAQLLDFLDFHELQTLVVATKMDKLNKAQQETSLARLGEGLALPEGQPILFSSQTGFGRKEVWNYIQTSCGKR